MATKERCPNIFRKNTDTLLSSVPDALLDVVGHGSSGSRFRTLGRGISAADPGDIVLLRTDNYNEPQIISKAVTLRATCGTAGADREQKDFEECARPLEALRLHGIG